MKSPAKDGRLTCALAGLATAQIRRGQLKFPNLRTDIVGKTSPADAAALSGASSIQDVPLRGFYSAALAASGTAGSVASQSFFADVSQLAGARDALSTPVSFSFLSRARAVSAKTICASSPIDCQPIPPPREHHSRKRQSWSPDANR